MKRLLALFVGCLFVAGCTADFSPKYTIPRYKLRPWADKTDISLLEAQIDEAYALASRGAAIQNQFLVGTGSPQNNETAEIGVFYIQTDGGVGNVLHIKETGSGDTGWGKITTTVSP